MLAAEARRTGTLEFVSHSSIDSTILDLNAVSITFTISRSSCTFERTRPFMKHQNSFDILTDSLLFCMGLLNFQALHSSLRYSTPLIKDLTFLRNSSRSCGNFVVLSTALSQMALSKQSRGTLKSILILQSSTWSRTLRDKP